MQKKVCWISWNEISCQFAIDYLQSHGDKPILQNLKTNIEAEDGGVLRFTVPRFNQTLQVMRPI